MASYKSEKEILDVDIYDLDISQETTLENYDDNVLVLNLQCNYTRNGTDLSKITLKNKEIVFEIWEDTLERLYNLFIKNKVVKANMITHQEQDVWNGATELPLAHINDFEVENENYPDDRVITLRRYYNNNIDVLPNGSSVEDSNETFVSLLVTDENLPHIDRDVYPNGIPVLKRIFTNSDTNLSESQINMINFNTILTCKTDKLEEMKNDLDFFRVRIPKRGNTVSLWTKELLSNDIDIDIECVVNKVDHRDNITEEEAYYKETSGALVDPEKTVKKINGVSTNLIKYKIDADYKGQLLNLKNKNFKINYLYRDIKPNFNDYISERVVVDHVESRYGYMYIYFSKFVKDGFKDLELKVYSLVDYIEEPIYKLHIEERTISQVITYSTYYTYDIENGLYTYTFELDGKVNDEPNVTNYTLTPDAKKDSIISVSVIDNILTIVSNSKLCDRDAITKCTFRFKGKYSYTEKINKYDKKYITVNIKSDTELETDEKGNLYYAYCYDKNNNGEETYDDYGNVPFYTEINYLVDFYDPSTDLKVLNYEIKSDCIYIYIDEEDINKFNSENIISDIKIDFVYDYLKTTIVEDVECIVEDTYNIKINHDTMYNYTGKTDEYYIYEFPSYVELESSDEYECTIISKDIKWVLDDGSDIVYDVWYNKNMISVYLFKDIRYDYTDIRVEFYAGEYDHKNREVYETYRFRGFAEKSLETILKYFNCVKLGTYEFSIEDLRSKLMEL